MYFVPVNGTTLVKCLVFIASKVPLDLKKLNPQNREIKKKGRKEGVGGHTFNSVTQKCKAGGSVS